MYRGSAFCVPFEWRVGWGVGMMKGEGNCAVVLPLL